MGRLKGFIRRPSPAGVLAFIALGIAIGGTATALPGTRTVQDNDLRTNSVTARAIRADAVRPAEIQAGAVQADELGTIVVREAATAIPDGGSGRAEATCNAGEKIIGGGGSTQQSAPDAIFHGAHPSVGGGNTPVNGNTYTHWNAKATNEIGNLATVDVKAWAVCLQ
jgi:hypothetical protein